MALQMTSRQLSYDIVIVKCESQLNRKRQNSNHHYLKLFNFIKFICPCISAVWLRMIIDSTMCLSASQPSVLENKQKTKV